MTQKNDRQTSVRRELCRDWETLKKLRGKQRFDFLWDYYKWRMVVCICAVAVACTFTSILWEGQKPCRLRVCVVLDTEEDCSQWFSTFAQELRSDGKTGAVDVNLDQLFDRDNPYYPVQQMEVMTTVSSRRMDIAVCGEDMYRYLLELNACLSLENGLSQELYASLLDSGKLICDTSGLTADEHSANPQDGIRGYYAVDLSGSGFDELYHRGGAGDEPLYAVVISNTEHLEECEQLIRRLTES